MRLILKVFLSLVSDVKVLFDSEREFNRRLSGVLLNGGQLVDRGFIDFGLHAFDSFDSQANSWFEVFLLFPLRIQLIVVLILQLVFLLIFFERRDVVRINLDVVVIV